MSNQVIVHKGRVTTIGVSLGYNVSADVYSSEIRRDPEFTSPLLATWVVSWLTDGTDGELVLSLDDTITKQIEVDSGYMDLKRLTAGQPFPVFDRPLEVIFRGTVTA